MSIVRTPMGHWVVAEDCALGVAVRECGTFEFENNLLELRAVAPFIPDGGVVINAGACIGDHTVSYARMVGPQGTVYAFEPHPDSYAALARNTAHLNNVVPIPVALGERVGTDLLSLVPNVGSSYLGADDGHFPDVPNHTWPNVPVQLSMLDVEMRHLSRLDLIHLDAEGMEVQILQGGRKLIEKFRPVLYVEVTDLWLRRYGNTEAELHALLLDLGYDPMHEPRPGEQYNLLCLPSKSVLTGAV